MPIGGQKRLFLVPNCVIAAVLLTMITLSTSTCRNNLASAFLMRQQYLQGQRPRIVSKRLTLSPPRASYSLNHGYYLLLCAARHSTSTSTRTEQSSKSYHDDDEHDDDENDALMASRFGLNPLQNRFHASIVYHERYSFADWPPNHTFPMDKFERIAHALQTTHSRTIPTSNLPRPIIRSPKDFFRPLDFTDIIPHYQDEWLDSIMMDDNDDDDDNDQEFVTRFLQGQLTTDEARHIGFREQTNRPELIERTVLEVAGTILTCQLALQYGIASNVAGGTHHAHPHGGAGYTILNDLAVASNFLLTRTKKSSSSSSSSSSRRKLEKILVVDCDVHQGDGTAKFSSTIIPGLSTLSLHCESNYPTRKAQSTFDVAIHDGCRDDEYLEILEASVNRAIHEVRPDFVIYDAGVDIYEHDRLGRLNISQDGIRKRDRWVLERCVSAGIPVAAVVGGGYDKDVDALARRHAIVHEECAFVWRKYSMWKR